MLASVLIPTILYNNMLFPCFPKSKDPSLVSLALDDKCYGPVVLALAPPLASCTMSS